MQLPLRGDSMNITREQLLHLVAGAHNPARLELSHGKQVADEAGERVAVYLDWWAQRGYRGAVGVVQPMTASDDRWAA
jgi:hypothetical protein